MDNRTMDKWEVIYKREQERGLNDKSAVNEQAWIDFIRGLKIHHAVEIGTYKGLSTAFLATVADHVWTFDIADHSKRQNWIWHKAGLLDRITFTQNRNANDVKRVLKDVDFDFAFIDGVTPAEELEKMFKIVKRCGRVLIHNAKPLPKYAETTKFLNKVLKGDYARVGGHSVYWTA